MQLKVIIICVVILAVLPFSYQSDAEVRERTNENLRKKNIDPNFACNSMKIMIEAMDQAQKDEKNAAKIEELNRHIKTALDIFKVMCPTQYQEFLDGKKTNMEEFLKGAPGKGAAGKSAAGKSAAGKKNTEEKKNK